MSQDTWSTANHGVISPVDLSLALREVPTYLFAFLRSEHEEFRPNYQPVRDNIHAVIADNASRARPMAQRPREDIEPSRLRTWKREFEEFGFIYVDDDQRIRTTALGRMIRDLSDDLTAKINGANAHIASLALSVLSRHVLRNPLASADYPSNTNIHPYRAIWRAARELDNCLHWEELNRVLLKVLQEEDLPVAIDHIRASRPSSPDSYTETELTALGEPVVNESDETRRRITPWLSRAGFGGMFLQDGDNGFWRLVDSQVPLLDEALALPIAPPPPEAMVSREAYLEYVISGLKISGLQPSPQDASLIARVRGVVERFGGHKIVVLSGLPGTGKTRLARMLAADLTDNDPYRLAEIQFHEATTYDKFIEGFVPRPDGSGYTLEPMTLRVINERALRDPHERVYVLLIEEFTRADVHSVLGELLTYVEHRDRTFRLPLSQRELRIAPNLVFLATMNPRDRSALTLDDAVLRRLHQVRLQPEPAVLRELVKSNMNAETGDQLVNWYEQHAPILPFGHGEFADATSADDLHEIWGGTLIYFLLDPAGNVKPQYKEAAASYPWA
jgi:AAA domain (dynein-related subfamily)